MSGPQSLREARTKRQKAKVYKTSRNEFRSTLNAENGQPSKQDVADQRDNKIIKRKIIKANGKGIEENTEGEGSYDVNMIDADKASKGKVRDEKDGNNEKAETGEGKTQDDEKQDDDADNDHKVKKKKKRDDETDDNGGSDCNPKKNDGDLNDECDDDPNDRDDSGGDNGDDGRGNETQSNEGSNEKNPEEQDSELITGGADNTDITNEVPKCVDPYDLDFDDDDDIDDDSNEEDMYEFLPQDGGDGFDSDASIGVEVDEDLEEPRSAG